MDFFPPEVSDALRTLRDAGFSIWRPLWESAAARAGRDRAYYRDRLLTSPLFLQCRDNEIRDERCTPACTLPCRNRSRLIEEFAAELDIEDCLRAFQSLPPEEIRGLLYSALSYLSTVCEFFVSLRAKHVLSPAARGQTRYVHKDAIKKAGRCLGKVVCSFTDDDLKKCLPHFLQSLQPVPMAFSMYTTLSNYGPARFSDASRYYAIASILITLEYEQGTPDIVATRIKKAVQRARTAPQK